MPLLIRRWNKPGEPAQKVLLEKELKGQGYRTEFWVDKPGAVYRNRKHDADAAIWVLRGEAKVTLGNENDILRDGDRMDVAAENPYTLHVLGENSLLWLFASKKKNR